MRGVTFPVLLLVLVVFAALGGGCSRLRFIVDAVPAGDELTETTVLRDERRGFGFGSGFKVALIDVSGLLADARRRDFLGRGENPVDLFTESLRRAAADGKVRAVILRIDSPGGTVSASEIMYRELVHFREETGKPVIVLMSAVAASGGYYLACGGDEIIAHPSTITGSIGVLLQTINVSEGMRRIGIRADAITSGPNKTVGSPFEPMPPEHRALLQGVVDEFYASFIAVVTEARPGIAADDLRRVTDGRVVTGARAVAVGLVDSLGDVRDAFARAKERAGISSARVVKYHRPLDHVGSVYAYAPIPSPQINLFQLNVDAFPSGGAGFYYLWDPTVW